MLFNHYVLFYLDKYNEIWEVIRKLLKVKFAVNPVRDDKYLVAKSKIFNKINRTTFNNENNIPTERFVFQQQILIQY